MDERVCEWGPAGYDKKGNRHDYDVCQICQRVILPTERYRRLNEYEILKKALEQHAEYDVDGNSINWCANILEGKNDQEENTSQ